MGMSGSPFLAPHVLSTSSGHGVIQAACLARTLEKYLGRPLRVSDDVADGCRTRIVPYRLRVAHDPIRPVE